MYEGLKIPLSIELLCSVMIPISLKVTSDLVKGFLSKLIDWDLQMYDESSGTPSCSLNTGIPEDLALVDYVFADKTGTLTENQMVFCKCFIQGLVYSANIQDPSEDTFLNEAAREDRQCSKDFLLVMALCNTVVPCYSETGEVSYKAQSQDEEALVKAAAKAGVSLVAKKGMFSVLRVMGREVEYELLNVLEFTSDRKCMSVVVKQQPEGTILLLSKGADEVMFSRLAAGQQFQQALNATEQFSSEGLRTLCLTSRRISEEEYYQWSQMFETARLSLFDREWKISEAAKILERDLVLLGITAIKDKLQDGVQDTIDILRRAGINIWMLTGDKKITALEIARACNLLSAESQLMEVVGQNLLEVKSCINHLLDILASFSSFHQKDAALIVEGTTLEMALMEDKDAFTALAMKVKTGICCRVTPSQKAQLVMLMKEGNFRTMAVGDGGNDVRMIQVAHVGVGITGHEGCQAARAADYSLGRFRFLSRLILVHGRYAYTRMAFIVQYSFYKSMLLAWIQIIYCFYSYISGSSLFNTYSLMVYNFLYTSLPCFMYAIEQDVPENVVMSNPAILQNCRKRRFLNMSTFSGWLATSLFHAEVVFLVVMGTYCNERSDSEEIAVVAVSGCVWLTTITAIMESRSFTMYHFAAIICTLFTFYASNLLVSLLRGGGMYMIMFRLILDPNYWLAMLLIVFMGFGASLGFKYLWILYQPSTLDVDSIQKSSSVASVVVSRTLNRKEKSSFFTRFIPNKEPTTCPLLSKEDEGPLR